METSVSITVNGKRHERRIPARMLLVDFLRDELRLTGTHVGCTYEAVCGACTVQLDGRAVKSCMLLAAQVGGHEVRTIEGLEEGGGTLHPLQVSFNKHHALQCGYCTPGILMNIEEFLRVSPNPTETEIRRALVGNICRCTGYSHIIEAVQDAARKLSSSRDQTGSGA